MTLRNILINTTLRETRMALLENNVLHDIALHRKVYRELVGNIYKGRVIRLLPGLQAAFVDIGMDCAAFLHASDIQPNFQGNISELLYPGKIVWVQVYKEPIGSKGPRLTTQLTLVSRYLILMPYQKHIAISQKITNPKEQERLLKIKLSTEEDYGYIFRTAAENVSEDKIQSDFIFLKKDWEKIKERGAQAKPGDTLYEAIPMVLRELRNWANDTVEKIIVDDEIALQKIKIFLERYAPHLSDRLEYYSDMLPLFDCYGVEKALQEVLQRNVFLKSGSHLVFDQTEAMTTIDVNTGSHQSAEDLILKTNLEAVEKIAEQVRLRNLGGIIIIDFIDMSDTKQKEQLLSALTLALSKDSVPTQVSELTSLGLVQMTRKRSRESLEHILCVPCVLCQQRGLVKSLPTICYDILRQLQRLAATSSSNGFHIVAAKSVVTYLTEKESALLETVKIKIKKSIQFKIEPTYTEERYHIFPEESLI